MCLLRIAREETERGLSIRITTTALWTSARTSGRIVMPLIPPRTEMESAIDGTEDGDFTARILDTREDSS